MRAGVGRHEDPGRPGAVVRSLGADAVLVGLLRVHRVVGVGVNASQGARDGEGDRVAVLDTADVPHRHGGGLFALDLVCGHGVEQLPTDRRLGEVQAAVDGNRFRHAGGTGGQVVGVEHVYDQLRFITGGQGPEPRYLGTTTS